jgi:hypothetical protein
MADDIVARLREEGFVTHMARLPRESKILHDAADEIERLRRDYSCICNEMRRMMQERDAARAEVALLRAPSTSLPEADDAMRAYAETRGWDCFKVKEEIDE